MLSHRFIYFACCILGLSNGARILGIFPTPSISHQVAFGPLMEALARRGHHVVTMTTDPVKHEVEIPTLTQIDVHDISYEKWNAAFNFVEIKERNTPLIALFGEYNIFMSAMTEIQMNTPAMKRLLNDPSEKFDLCFFEASIPTAYPIKDHFNCSMILFSSHTGGIQDFDAFGNPSHPILYPDFLTTHFGDADFWQRIELVFHDIKYRYLYNTKWVKIIDFYARRTFGQNTRPVDEIRRDADMLFLNMPPLLGMVRPTVPGIVYTGFMHIKPNKPLKLVSRFLY